MTQKVEISLRIPGTLPIPELMPLINAVEGAGFYGAGILDSQLLCRDVFVTMGAAAVQTSQLTLFWRSPIRFHVMPRFWLAPCKV